ncbi:uncharacterized protein TrAtP1_013068 [Trichoderma atroviride]|uniref:Uncharacterized protein n=1 Tax=Hypocrea atroviridis (strain ATCC 20476 / IMI 206040) TaxID=452589 RepID=G9NTE6_HYPAI|nr:uncharacterized protein TRIATDRAFT_308002 [Trichoderma atroviride IMI 206040]EHK45988.1 hypothetical protein TRIATDRAFT_308002 [Trichoderma atroviride IMI 206040]UKZ72130.1 hypothetical protein TrAtP1_013068 [Trichoderma atroviride]
MEYQNEGNRHQGTAGTDLYILPGTSDPSRLNPGTRKPPTSAASDHDLRNVQEATGGANPQTGKARLCQDEARKRAHHRQGSGPSPSLTHPTCHARSPKNASSPICRRAYQLDTPPTSFCGSVKASGPQEGPPSTYENYIPTPTHP